MTSLLKLVGVSSITSSLAEYKPLTARNNVQLTVPRRKDQNNQHSWKPFPALLLTWRNHLPPLASLHISRKKNGKGFQLDHAKQKTTYMLLTHHLHHDSIGSHSTFSVPTASWSSAKLRISREHSVKAATLTTAGTTDFHVDPQDQLRFFSLQFTLMEPPKPSIHLYITAYSQLTALPHTPFKASHNAGSQPVSAQL